MVLRAGGRSTAKEIYQKSLDVLTEQNLPTFLFLPKLSPYIL